VTRHSLEERRRRGSRVLLVEDNQVNQRVAVRLLERLGVRCDVASNGADAVDAVARQPYDLVLMDCQMPVLDGYEATRRIRTSEGESPRTPVVALTAGALDGDRERCLAAGMDEYITKPIRIEELQRVLESFLGTPAPHPVDAPTSTVDGVPVDLGRLRSIAGSDVTFQRHLVGLFVDECNGQIGEVGTSLASCRATEARRAAHSLKGAAANIGAEELRRLAAEIEVAAKDEAFGTCRGLLPALEREAEAVAAYLTREVLEKGGGSVAGADSST
jgi:CheY-like chemotaxis protein/HPt (histidine-containing phosphotransfer) domain-containing protein